MCEQTTSDPMSFLDLDILSSYLIEETKELAKEFELKMNFVRVQDKNCLENEKQLIFIDQLVKNLNKCVLQTELELQEQDIMIVEAESVISRYEALCMNSSNAPEFNLPKIKPRNYQVLLKLILSADCSAAQYNKLKDEIELYNNEARKHLDHRKMIVKYINFHQKSLELMEFKVNKVQKTVDEVAKRFKEMSKKKQRHLKRNQQ